MARLALAVEDESQLGSGHVLFRVAARAGQQAYRNLGRSILIYRLAGGSMVLFLGSGRVQALEDETPDFQLCRLRDYRAFAAPVTSHAEAGIPGARRSLSLSDARFDEILRAAEADVSASALAEAAAVFAEDREASLEAYLKIHDRALQRWRYRCVFTGAQFDPGEQRPHPQLRIVAIRPRELGGPLHVRNYLPMLPLAEHAWNHGHITLGPGYGFEVAERLIDPEFHEQLLPTGRLELPAEPSLWPDPELVAYHRNHVFDRAP